jgi:hypothetical protein
MPHSGSGHEGRRHPWLPDGWGWCGRWMVDAEGLEQMCPGQSAPAPPPLVDQDRALRLVETPRVWDVPRQHASRRGPP